MGNRQYSQRQQMGWGSERMKTKYDFDDPKQVIWEILFDLSRALNPLEGWTYTVHEFALALFDKLENMFGEGTWNMLMEKYDIPTEFEKEGLE